MDSLHPSHSQRNLHIANASRRLPRGSICISVPQTASAESRPHQATVAQHLRQPFVVQTTWAGLYPCLDPARQGTSACRACGGSANTGPTQRRSVRLVRPRISARVRELGLRITQSTRLNPTSRGRPRVHSSDRTQCPAIDSNAPRSGVRREVSPPAKASWLSTVRLRPRRRVRCQRGCE